MGSKYTKLRLRPKLRPGPCWGVYNAPSQDSWMDLRGPLRVGREGQSAKGRREGRGWDGMGREMGGEVEETRGWTLPLCKNSCGHPWSHYQGCKGIGSKER